MIQFNSKSSLREATQQLNSSNKCIQLPHSMSFNIQHVFSIKTRKTSHEHFEDGLAKAPSKQTRPICGGGGENGLTIPPPLHQTRPSQGQKGMVQMGWPWSTPLRAGSHVTVQLSATHFLDWEPHKDPTCVKPIVTNTSGNQSST